MSGHDYGLFVLSITAFLGLIDTTVLSCPRYCVCKDTICPKEFVSLCPVDNDTWMQVRCDYLEDGTDLPPNTKSLFVTKELSSVRILSSVLQDLSSLRVFSTRLANIYLKFDDAIEFMTEVAFLNLSGGNLKVFPINLERFPELELLDLSGNSFSERLDLNLTSPSLKTLDLSQNRICSLSIQRVFPNMRFVFLQGNILKSVPTMKFQGNLELLNLSKNLITFEPGGVKSDAHDGAICQVLPSSLKTLLLRDNLIKTIQANGCRLLEGLHSLEELDLGYNLLRSIPNQDKFGLNVAITLKSLKLDGNSIYSVDREAFALFGRLRFLSLSNNHITSIPVELFQTFFDATLYSNHDTKALITLERNPVSCDCKERSLLKFLHSKENGTKVMKSDISCRYPATLFGKKLIDLDEKDLDCTDIVLRQAENATCKEHHDCKLACLFDGLPHPQVHWISPEGKVISIEALPEDSSLRSIYSLSQDGQQLSIKSLEMQLTGIYKCIANNSLDSSESFAQVGLLPDPVGSIVAIAVSAVSFGIAIGVNCVNMCKCYCENLDVSKEDKEEQELEDLKMQSPMKSKLKGLHESEASLNANKYYRKYDFACQHIFLDAVIRGAHTVKQTLYDAKNSEFSNNVWEYASHLRDRLHIELPSSVQFPRVSMPSISLPSISMPTISMPSMPNLQSINTNIERLGTSVISRSQNLATSVGSVFTLRWLRYGNSDNDSDSDVESPTVSEVRAHVHKLHDEDQESSADNSPTMYPRTFTRRFIPKSVWSRKPSSTRCTTSRDSYATPSRSKSVRFGNVETFRITRSSSCSELPSAVSVATMGDEDSVEQAHDITVELPEMRQFETSV